MRTERTVYGRDFRVTSRSLWIVQRASGLLLGPLVGLHVWWPGMARNAWLDAALLAVVVMHGYSGVRRMDVTRSHAARVAAAAFVWCASVALCGVLVVAAIG